MNLRRPREVAHAYRERDPLHAAHAEGPVSPIGRASQDLMALHDGGGRGEVKHPWLKLCLLFFRHVNVDVSIGAERAAAAAATAVETPLPLSGSRPRIRPSLVT